MMYPNRPVFNQYKTIFASLYGMLLKETKAFVNGETVFSSFKVKFPLNKSNLIPPVFNRTDGQMVKKEMSTETVRIMGCVVEQPGKYFVHDEGEDVVFRWIGCP